MRSRRIFAEVVVGDIIQIIKQCTYTHLYNVTISLIFFHFHYFSHFSFVFNECL